MAKNKTLIAFEPYLESETTKIDAIVSLTLKERLIILAKLNRCSLSKQIETMLERCCTYDRLFPEELMGNAPNDMQRRNPKKQRRRKKRFMAK